MAASLFQLGEFQFTLANGAPQTLERTADYRWEVQERLLREPSAQFLGPGEQAITLDGTLYPGFTGRQSTMQQLRDMAVKGEPFMLTDGLGRVHGRWALRRVREGQSTFMDNGAARAITFSLELTRYGEDNPGAAAAPGSVAAISAAGAALPAVANLGQFTGAGSAGALAQQLPAAVSQAAQGAGFSIGQLATIAGSIGSGNYVGAALDAFGLTDLSASQQGVWGQLGIEGLQMVQQMGLGRGAPAMSVALEALRPATGAMLNTLGGSTENGQALGQLVGNAGTVAAILNVDPFITDAVRQLVQP
jgi:phage protein U